MTLTLQNVTKTFRAVTAINDVSLQFAPGLIHGLIGPNGAGKSTLINLMSGAFAPSQGTISLEGQVLNGLPKHKVSLAGVARTFQNVRLFDHLSALENLEVCFYPVHRGGVWREIMMPAFGRRRAQARRDHCLALLDQCGIADWAHLPARALPYGRQRILEIARALVRNPSVLLLDEPAAGLNHGETADLMRRLDALRAPDRAIIVVEHDMDLVMSLSDRIAVLNFGSLLFTGTPAQVQASDLVQEAYLGTQDELDEIRTLAADRRARGGLRADAGIVRH